MQQWTTFLGARGAASRSFVASQYGTVSITLQAGDSPQLTAAVQPGSYCVLVFDVGGISDQISFAIQLVYP